MKVINKKAKFNYKLIERFEVGIALQGAEVKAIRRGNVDLTQSFAKIIGDEIYLINTNVPGEGKKDYNSRRIIKLLLHKKEIISIKSKIKAKKLTLIPLSLYTKGRLIKAEIALAKAKRKFEKKEAIKKRDIEKEIEAELKQRKL
ncbi:SsrA-binding protein [Candidatus Woesebacteria bacterium RIFCSPHIGHO2_01_FULL_38_10]|uniref:SsrA-binding protein n=1 Tax=Candidatus Woesebacteria bacterium RIFCSPLOWO2_01_FULL_39_10b TaxID=1802517 RepID=A0A1F8B8F2_9BACT|nr:MAG: SsrA-binding protein [Candidatus Woesebacteria bacterium RIFCSPHIGHO2_01_FULL_38_10]OGM60210.1 MAG: SsrA-binding protein [Candidatus Woesebacteria bacterium RIFCSPLOWO2_01_FULL_39_10b]